MELLAWHQRKRNAKIKNWKVLSKRIILGITGTTFQVFLSWNSQKTFQEKRIVIQKHYPFKKKKKIINSSFQVALETCSLFLQLSIYQTEVFPSVNTSF